MQGALHVGNSQKRRFSFCIIAAARRHGAPSSARMPLRKTVSPTRIIPVRQFTLWKPGPALGSDVGPFPCRWPIFSPLT
jgi:hypothetical protein